MKRVARMLTVILGMLILPCLTFGQRGSSIVGRVSDQSGGVVPDVAINVNNINTGISYTAQTTNEGIYTLPSVPIGTYRVEAQKPGFKTGVAENIIVSVAQQVTLDFTLQVGEVVDQLTVTSETPLLDLTNPEIGSSMNDELYHELPNTIGYNVRNAQTFIFSSLPGATGDSFAGSINGGQALSHEILIDGISASNGYYASGADTAENVPPVDAIAEFKLQASNLSAQYGGTSGGVVSFITKSGTNQFHGNLYEYHRNKVLDAAGWTVNTFAPNGVDADGKALRSHNILNNFGGTVGGPVILPKLYDGHNKTFFFVAYDGLRTASKPAAFPITMPTTDQLQGNFSRLLDLNNTIGTDALGRPIFQGAIYDPATTRAVTAGRIDSGTGLVVSRTGMIRDAFGFDPTTGQPLPGQANLIPQSRWSRISSNIVPFYSSIRRLNDDLLRNTVSFGYGALTSRRDYLTIKVDHNINDKHKLTTSFTDSGIGPTHWGGVFVGGGPLSVDEPGDGTQYIVRISENWTINNHLLNHFGFGFNRLWVFFGSPVRDENWAAQIGLTGADPTHFPESNFGTSCSSPGFQAISCIGRSSHSTSALESYIFVDDMSYVRGKHQFKWGGEARRYRFNWAERSSTSGRFRWSNAQTALPEFQAPFGTFFETGWPFASFLLGAADNVFRNVVGTTPGYRFSLFSLYFQDDWRITPKLTLNYGLRWDVPTSRTEAHDRMSSFDPAAPNPGAGNLPGALVFLQDIGRESFQDSYYRQFGPRFGFAYQLTSKTVLRGGYGITYVPPDLKLGLGNIQGFNSSLSVSHSNPDPRFVPAPNPWDPVLQWDNGIPSFQATLPNTDPARENFDRSGAFVNWLRKDSLRQPYTQLWSLGIQRELPMDSVLEVNYVGSKGTRLIAGLFAFAANAAPSRFMGLVDANGNALVNKTFGDLTPADWSVLNSAGVTGKPYPSFPDSVPVSQALKPYPQYNGIQDLYPNFANSNYHSLQMNWRNRPKRGLTFVAAYTFSKLLTNSEVNLAIWNFGGIRYAGAAQWLDDRRQEKSVADFDVPHNLKLTWSYELPVGRGKRFLNRGGVLDKILGGWKSTGILGYASGNPLGITSFTPVAISAGSLRADVRGDVSSAAGSVKGNLDPFNGTPFLNVPSEFDSNGCKGPFCQVPTSADGYALRPGTAPRLLGNLRTPWSQNESLGVGKFFRFTERTNLEFQAHFFNPFNRHGFGRPDTFLESPTFGRILFNAYAPRGIQLALRLNW